MTSKITFANGKYATPCGEIAVSWEKNGDEFIYTAALPNAINVNIDLQKYRVVERTDDGEKTVITLTLA